MSRSLLTAEEFQSFTPRQRLHFYFEDTLTPLGKAIDIFLVFLNIVFCAISIIEVQSFADHIRTELWMLELSIVFTFLIEYIVRLYAAKNRVKHVTTIYSMIDLISILPSLLLILLPPTSVYIGFTKLLRVIRVFRIFRWLRFTETNDFFFGTISLHFLKVCRLLLSIFMIFFIGSILIWTIEGPINPQLHSFLDALYFIVVTITTVGFGDITPVTNLGKEVTLVMILSGILIIPWQLSEIIKEWMIVSQKKEVNCHKCGLTHHDRDASHCKL